MSSEKTFIVTGGNSGIGLAIAEALLQMQKQVVIVSRDANKGQQALTLLRQGVASTNIELVVGDLGTIAGVRQLAEELLARYPHSHCLINNAGVWPSKLQHNADGLDECTRFARQAGYKKNHAVDEQHFVGRAQPLSKGRVSTGQSRKASQLRPRLGGRNVGTETERLKLWSKSYKPAIPTLSVPRAHSSRNTSITRH